MKKLLFLLVMPLLANGQKVDTVITTDSYTSYFCKQYHQPLYVAYKLYKGGGNCSRAGFSFKNNIKTLPAARQKDYDGSGYDEGHLANAEDFAYDCTKEQETFTFYNCLPQTPALNRGVWKHYETEIRKLSQTDSILIICGGAKYKKTSTLYVPAVCWKIARSLSTGKVIYALYFTNTAKAACKEETLSQLKKQLPCKLILAQ